MKVTLLSYGTRGDVQPFTAIGLALARRGHDVVVAAPHDHLEFVRSTGLQAMPLPGDSRRLLHGEHGAAWVRDGDALAGLRAVTATFEEHADQAVLDAEAATEDADVVVSGVLSAGFGRLHSERRGVPHVIAHTFPGLPSSEVHHAAVAVPAILPGPMRRALGRAAFRVVWSLLRKYDDRARARYGLPQGLPEPTAHHQRRGGHSLHLWSPSLVPKPADWGDKDHVTGFCLLPSTAREKLGEDAAARELEAFFDGGPPPFYLGLGSMPVLEPGRTVDMFVDVVDRLGQRALIGGTFQDEAAVRARLSEGVRLVGRIDHDAVFPRCIGAVHHGGAGTTATSLRAGLPTFVASVFGDQPFWGQVVERHRVGCTEPFRRLDETRLLRGLERLLRPEVRERAAALGERMRAETDGATVAAEVIERVAARSRSR